MNDEQRKLEKLQYVRGALDRLQKVAEEEQFPMLGYLLEVARQEAERLELETRRASLEARRR